jgi:hypothetical protein
VFSAARRGANNPTTRTFVEGLVNLLGLRGTREALQNPAARSPIQDAMKEAGAIRMGVRELPELPQRAPKPEFGPGSRAVSAPPSSSVPLQRGPIRMEPGYTRGGTGGTQLRPGAVEPRAAERFEVEGQLRIPFTQPGKGGQMYSPVKSSKSADVVSDSMRKSVGDVLDAADFPRYKAAEGQRAMDLEPDVTREMIQRMAPALSRAPGVPDPMRPMGVQMMDLSQIDPRVTGAIGAAALGVGMDRILRDMDFGSKDMPVETKATESADLASAQEAAQINELISTVVADASQQGGIYAELVLQNAPRDPSSYRSVEDYKAAQAQFLSDVTSGAFNQAAKMYEQQQLEAAAPKSEQTGEDITTEALTSELGSDDMANAVGAGRYATEAMLAPPALSGPIDTATYSQGAADLATAATPRPQPETRMASTAMMQSIQDDIARRMAAEADPRNAQFIAARNALGSNPTQARVANVERIGREAFYENFPQFR